MTSPNPSGVTVNPPGWVDPHSWGPLPSVTWNSVLNFGADPTGQADSAEAFQAALNASFGTTVYVPPGTYRIGATISPPAQTGVTSGACLRGAGWGSILRFDQAAVPTLIAMAGTTQAKFDIRDLRIQQSGSADGGTAIDISHFINSVISNISIDSGGTNHVLTGILGNATGTEYNVISDCRISVAGASAQGIALQNNSNSNVIRNCRVLMGSSATAVGVYVNAHSNTIDHVDIESGPGTAISLDTLGHATTIINPYLEANGINVAFAATVQAPVIIGGTIQSATTANIQDNGAVSPVILTAWPNSATTIINQLPPSGSPQAADQSLIAWSYDVTVPGNSTSPTAGTVQLIRVTVRTATTITNVLAHVVTAGTTLTTGQNFAGLYNAAGTLLSATADQTAAWGSTGLKTMALSAPQAVAAGIYYVALLSNGTTPPAFARGAGLTGESALLNAGLTAATARFATGPAAQTALPSPITMSGNALATVGFWAAVS